MFVIMCNDYPQYVCKDENKTIEFVNKKRRDNLNNEFETGMWWHYKEVEEIS